MIELIAKYIVINHTFGTLKAEYEYRLADAVKHNPDLIRTPEDLLDLEQTVADLYDKREAIIEELRTLSS